MQETHDYKPVELTEDQKRPMLPMLWAARKQMPSIDFKRLCFEPAELDDQTFEAILGLLTGPMLRRHKFKRVVCWILIVSPLTYKQRETACTALGDLITRRKLRGIDKWQYRPGKASFVGLLAFLVLIGVSTLNLSTTGQLAMYSVTSGAGFVVLFITVVYDARQRLAICMEANSAVARLNVRESIDILASVWRNDLDIKTPVGCLNYALPALSEDDYGRMEAATVPGLIRLLEWYSGLAARKVRSDDRLLNLLTAIAKIGDSKAVSAVRRLAQGTRESDAVRNAANHALAILTERSAREQAQQMLLRSSCVSANPASLLRATRSVPNGVGEDTLLRVADGTKEAEQRDIDG